MVAEPLHHRVDGPEGAPVVVLSHALGPSSEMWQRVLAPLATRYRVLRCDTRGHGRSPAPPGPYAIADLVADQLALLDELGIDRASFVGLSMGGAVCMLLAATAPERVDRLVLCSTAEKFGEPAGWLERAATVRDQGTGALADGTMERWFTPGFAVREPDAVERIREIFRRPMPRATPRAARRSRRGTSPIGWARSPRRRWSSAAGATPRFRRSARRRWRPRSPVWPWPSSLTRRT